MRTGDGPVAPASEKRSVADFWEAAACGEVYASGSEKREKFKNQAEARYALEPYILDFARFGEGAGREVLEIGVGMGADHEKWAEAKPSRLVGVDLTWRAVLLTRERLRLSGHPVRVLIGDAERLPFSATRFELVYSYGVLHHSPQTAEAIRELARVIRSGGVCRVMIYHRHSPVGWLLWVRYALLRGLWGLSLSEVYSQYLESPGTKAFTVREAREMFRDFSKVRTRAKLGFGDLLQGEVGQRHRGLALSILKRLWPRWLLKRFDGRIGLGLLIEAQK